MVEYNPRRWSSVLIHLHGSVMPRLVPRIGSVCFVSLLAFVLYEQTGFKLSSVTHTLVGAALGLLLVFRTNTSYDRYWEGRKLLGMMVNRLRDLMRQVAAYLDADQQAQAETQRRLHVTFALIRQYLRFETDLSVLGAPITPEEAKALEPVRCRPVVYLVWLSQIFCQATRCGNLHPEAFRQIDQNLTSLIDSLGGAERIVRTPVPFAYAQHIKGFLFIFCFSVPFVLVEHMGWFSVAGSAAVAYALFGIEEIGVEIEDPFGRDANDLPLEAIEQGITTATSDILKAGLKVPVSA
ncbi:MAG: membrane protein [Candidatus Xenobia bacterium]